MARPSPVREAAPACQSPAAINAAPARARAIAKRTAAEAGSRRSHHEKTRVNSGVVLTRRTEAATEV
jgi:hypothetical protein